MSDPSADFDPESREEREVAAEAAGDRSELLSLMAHTYRAGGARTGSLVVAHAHRPNHELGGGADGVAAHVDVLERIAPALRAAHRARNAHRLPQHRGPAVPNIRRVAVPCSDLGGERVRERARPRGRRAVELAGLLSTDLRKPTIKTPAVEAVSRRLRRVYTPLFTVLIAAWIVRLTVFTPPESGVVATASVGAIPGLIILAGVACFISSCSGSPLRTRPRQAKGELQSTDRRGGGSEQEWK